METEIIAYADLDFPSLKKQGMLSKGYVVYCSYAF